jgi:hypothetical protein
LTGEKFMRDAVDKLGFGFPSFRSQVAGSMTPAGRGMMGLPPRALARLGDLMEGGSTWEYGNTVSGSEIYSWPTGIPGVYNQASIDSSGNPVWSMSGEGTSGETTEYTITAPDASTQPSGVSSDMWGNILKTAQLVQSAVAQQRIIDLNIARAKAGLPLLDPRNFSPSAAVNFGLTPQAQQALLIGGAAILGIMLLRGRNRK